MNAQIELPTYPDEYLAELSPSKLTDILIEGQDRVPRNVIDTCVRCGDAMTEYLRQLHEDDFLWLDNENEPEEIADGIWWLRLHAAMILGQIPSEQAGLLLVEFMRRMSLKDDENLQDWLAGQWSALFLNKPISVLPALRTLCEDRGMDWYMRSNALDPLIAAASRQGGDALEQALAWLAKIAGDESEDREFRLNTAALLLHFPRPQYRQLLEELAALQSGWGIHFDRQSIEQAYAGKYLPPEWERFKTPLKFYEPEAITQRQIRWREEDEKERQLILSGNADYPNDPYDPYYYNEPYLRTEPKIGRNDPCPCGSGKKYKKCCLEKE
jgi:hypothetical protein